MKSKIVLFTLTVMMGLSQLTLQSQIAVNNDDSDPDPSAMLDVKSTSHGMLIPRMTASERDAIGSPADGLIVFVTTDSSFYYKRANGWVKLVAGADDDWVISGNNIYSNVSGNVGIGLNNPQNLLHVSHLSSGATVAKFETSSETYIEIKGGSRIWGLVSDNSPDVFRIRDVTMGGSGSDRFAIDANGYVGIGITAPTTRLDVDGQIRIRGGNPGNYKVLTSDANGMGSWGPNFSLKFPDGVFPMTPVTYDFYNGNFNVPQGKNLYITNIYSTSAGNVLTYNGMPLHFGYNNYDVWHTFEGPLILAGGMTLSGYNGVVINGFLADATVNPVVNNTGLTVPSGYVLVVTSVCTGNNTSRQLTINGQLVYYSRGNNGYTSAHLNGIKLPLLVGPNESISFNGGTINGYFMPQ